jgi:hypothetical protein
MKNEWLFQIAYMDAAEPWQYGFQDAATPMMQGIIECAQVADLDCRAALSLPHHLKLAQAKGVSYTCVVCLVIGHA